MNLKLVLMSLCLTVCIFVDLTAQTRISGRVLGSKGQVLPSADIIVQHDSIVDSLIVIPTDSNGHFSFETEQVGLVVFWAAGVDHAFGTIRLLALTQDTIEDIIVRLGTHQYSPTFDSVAAVGEFSQWSKKRAIPLLPDSSGKYWGILPVTKGKLQYQLTGFVTFRGRFRQVNGTQSDRYVYDHGGDYISIIESEADSIKIWFDPSRLPLVYKSMEVAFGNSNQPEAWFARLVSVRDSIAAKAQRNDPSALADAEMLVDQSYGQVEYKQLARLLYCTLKGVSGRRSDIANQVLAEVPANSLLWSVDPNASYDVFRLAGLKYSDTTRIHYMNTLITTNPNPGLLRVNH